jgi:hypothetical protein
VKRETPRGRTASDEITQVGTLSTKAVSVREVEILGRAFDVAPGAGQFFVIFPPSPAGTPLLFPVRAAGRYGDVVDARPDAVRRGRRGRRDRPIA